MKVILTYQGTVMLAGTQIPLAGYWIGEDFSQLNENLAKLIDGLAQDSGDTSPPTGAPDVQLKIALELLPSPSTPSVNSGSAGSSPSPTTTASASPTPPSGTSSPASAGTKSGSVPQVPSRRG